MMDIVGVLCLIDIVLLLGLFVVCKMTDARNAAVRDCIDAVMKATIEHDALIESRLSMIESKVAVMDTERGEQE